MLKACVKCGNKNIGMIRNGFAVEWVVSCKPCNTTSCLSGGRLLFYDSGIWLDVYPDKIRSLGLEDMLI